jgi:carbamoyl-phosphate synthase small subunit
MIGERTGEVVFKSYHGQIVVMSQPHIGDYGANGGDDESHRAWVAGFVVMNFSR